MARIKFFVISCSSDVPTDARSLYVWGEGQAAPWLPDTIREAGRRIRRCKMKTGCTECDAEIHEVEINRTKATLFNRLESSEKNWKSAEPYRDK